MNSDDNKKKKPRKGGKQKLGGMSFEAKPSASAGKKDTARKSGGVRKPKAVSEDIADETVLFRDCITNTLDGVSCPMSSTDLSDEQYADFAAETYGEIAKLIAEDRIDIWPAYKGKDFVTDANVWDYGSFKRILMNNGYCAGCSDAYIEVFTMARKENGDPYDMMTVSIADVECDDAKKKLTQRIRKRLS